MKTTIFEINSLLKLLGALSGGMPGIVIGCNDPDCPICSSLRGDKDELKIPEERLLSAEYPDEMVATQTGSGGKRVVLLTTEHVARVKKLLPMIDRLESLRQMQSDSRAAKKILAGELRKGFDMLSDKNRHALGQMCLILQLWLKVMLETKTSGLCDTCPDAEACETIKSEAAQQDVREAVAKGAEEFVLWLLGHVVTDDSWLAEIPIMKTVLDAVKELLTAIPETLPDLKVEITRLNREITTLGRGLPVDDREALIKMAVIRRPFSDVRNLALTLPDPPPDEPAAGRTDDKPRRKTRKPCQGQCHRE